MSSFQSGDKVKVVHGTFTGMVGTVVSPAEAGLMREKAGQPPSVFLGHLAFVWVVLEIFGRPVLVELEPFQIEPSD
jgi:transcription antitermination factor NusG